MSILNNSLLLGADAGGAAGYQISRSLRFSSIDSAYLSRTPASAGNRKTWSLSFWIKFNVNSGNQYIFAASPDGYTSDFHFAYLRSDGTIKWDDVVGGSNVQLNKISNQVFRDFSAWYHFLFVVDTTNGTAANRNRLYVNGSEITWASGNNFTSNADSSISRACVHHIGGLNQSSSYLSAYLADIHFIDGQALDPSSFVETSATTGQLIPKQYTGSFGTNGFWLKFSDNSAATATTLGKDYSGNNNNWSPSNLSVTAGAGNDSLVDTPTSYGTDTGAGGEVRGNYCTLNPLILGPGASLSNGNLEASTSASDVGACRGTIGVSSGKWYFEAAKTGGVANITVGIVDAATPVSAFIGNSSNSYSYYGYDGKKVNNSTQTTYGASYTTGDIIGVALDLDAGTLTFYKNGISQGQAFSGISGTFFPAACDESGGSAATFAFNFGQRPWAYTPPANHRPIVDTLLPAPVVAKPSTVFDTVLWTGNNTGQTITMPGSFSPDLVWTKTRNIVNNHWLFDVIRGVDQGLSSSSTTNELTRSSSVTAFGSTGFTLGTSADVNSSSYTYVGWAWDAGSSTVTNTAGSITSQVRANASAGFSIVSFTGTGSDATVGHGLGVAPSVYCIKKRSGTSDWAWFTTAVDGSVDFLFLNTTAAKTDAGGNYGVAPTSTVFSLGGASSSINDNGGTYVAYCFAPVAGYSSAFSFTGNGSSDGPMVWLGFKPRFLFIKRTDSTSFWHLYDTARNTYNVTNSNLWANGSDAEITNSAYDIDILSNGFKLRTSDAARNASGGTYVGFAWAENPFQYARAR